MESGDKCQACKLGEAASVFAQSLTLSLSLVAVTLINILKSRLTLSKSTLYSKINGCY